MSKNPLHKAGSLCYGVDMNKAEKRRNRIIKILDEAEAPVSASSMAEQLSVSRQIIVGDVAVLRAAGNEIYATPRGYVLGSKRPEHNYPFTGMVACKHGREELKDELYTIVDFGATVINVMVEHPIYGQLTGYMYVSSRYEVDTMFENALANEGTLLCDLTGGVHLHQIGCADEKLFRLIEAELKKKGFLIEN